MQLPIALSYRTCHPNEGKVDSLPFPNLSSPNCSISVNGTHTHTPKSETQEQPCIHLHSSPFHCQTAIQICKLESKKRFQIFICLLFSVSATALCPSHEYLLQAVLVIASGLHAFLLAHLHLILYEPHREVFLNTCIGLCLLARRAYVVSTALRICPISL